jgi:hypothetical protein
VRNKWVGCWIFMICWILCSPAVLGSKMPPANYLWTSKMRLQQDIFRGPGVNHSYYTTPAMQLYNCEINGFKTSFYLKQLSRFGCWCHLRGTPIKVIWKLQCIPQGPR